MASGPSLAPRLNTAVPDLLSPTYKGPPCPALGMWGAAQSPGWSRGSGSGIYLPPVNQETAFKMQCAGTAWPPRTGPS